MLCYTIVYVSMLYNIILQYIPLIKHVYIILYPLIHILSYVVILYFKQLF